MTITLGLKPIPLNVFLYRGGGFVSAITSTANWPTGTAVKLQFIPDNGTPTIEWVALVEGMRIDFNRPSTDVDEVLNTKAFNVALIYSDVDTTSLVWAAGRVRTS